MPLEVFAPQARKAKKATLDVKEALLSQPQWSLLMPAAGPVEHQHTTQACGALFAGMASSSSQAAEGPRPQDLQQQFGVFFKVSRICACPVVLSLAATAAAFSAQAAPPVP